jgi:hypothetical protein
MKNEDNILDWRSTGRRKARRALYASFQEYKCFDCGKSTVEPPKDAPTWFDEIWPEEERVLTSQLQANHLTKDLKVNTEEYLEWLCPSCHKIKDSKTGVGETTIDESYW